MTVRIRNCAKPKLLMTTKSENSDDHHWCAGHVRYDATTCDTVFTVHSMRSEIPSVGYATALPIDLFYLQVRVLK